MLKSQMKFVSKKRFKLYRYPYSYQVCCYFKKNYHGKYFNQKAPKYITRNVHVKFHWWVFLSAYLSPSNLNKYKLIFKNHIYKVLVLAIHHLDPLKILYIMSQLSMYCTKNHNLENPEAKILDNWKIQIVAST